MGFDIAIRSAGGRALGCQVDGCEVDDWAVAALCEIWGSTDSIGRGYAGKRGRVEAAGRPRKGLVQSWVGAAVGRGKGGRLVRLG